MLTTERLELIEEASTRRGMRVGVYVAAVAVDAAKTATNPASADGADADRVRELTSEARKLRRLLATSRCSSTPVG